MSHKLGDKAEVSRKQAMWNEKQATRNDRNPAEKSNGHIRRDAEQYNRRTADRTIELFGRQEICTQINTNIRTV